MKRRALLKYLIVTTRVPIMRSYLNSPLLLSYLLIIESKFCSLWADLTLSALQYKGKKGRKMKRKGFSIATDLTRPGLCPSILCSNCPTGPGEDECLIRRRGKSARYEQQRRAYKVTKERGR